MDALIRELPIILQNEYQTFNLYRLIRRSPKSEFWTSGPSQQNSSPTLVDVVVGQSVTVEN